MTTYHMLTAIQELNRNGFYHGDVHIGNLIWTGSKMFIIDFNTIGNVRQQLEQAAVIRERIEKTLPPNWREYYDYSPFQEANKIESAISNGIRSDYQKMFVNQHGFRTVDNDKYNGYDNRTNGRDRFELLTNSIDTIIDEVLIYGDNEYRLNVIDLIIDEYNRIDSLSFS